METRYDEAKHGIGRVCLGASGKSGCRVALVVGEAIVFTGAKSTFHPACHRRFKRNLSAKVARRSRINAYESAGLKRGRDSTGRVIWE